MEIEEFDEGIVDESGPGRETRFAPGHRVRGEIDQTVPAEDLLKMEGVDRGWHSSWQAGVVTMEDLAELSVDELLEITGLDPVKGAELIMTARAPWFEDEQPSK